MDPSTVQSPAVMVGPGDVPASAANTPAEGLAAGAAGAAAPPTVVVPGVAPDSVQTHQICIDPVPASPADTTLTELWQPWTSPAGEIDLLLPQPVIDWMDERLFREGHDGWHIVRKCFGGGGSIFGRTPNTLCEREEFKPAAQECEAPSDGFEFLVAHRHMIQDLRHAFPTHQEMFEGFPSFPYDASDVPEPWRERFGSGWSAQVIEMAQTLEDIENNLDRFPTDGDLGSFIQCGAMVNGATRIPGSSIHGALHFKWIVNGSPVLLGNQATNPANFMFWKLHGWIDNVWERYRVAKGLTPQDPELLGALTDQCLEMHMLGKELGPQSGQTTVETLPEETGYFHEAVRPVLEKHCSGCHSGRSPEGLLVLGGMVSSADIVANLVDVQTLRGGQFKRVVAGDPEHSWLYLKPSGHAGETDCMGMCNVGVMPPTGMVTLTEAELGTLRQWIMDGAPVPTEK